MKVRAKKSVKIAQDLDLGSLRAGTMGELTLRENSDSPVNVEVFVSPTRSINLRYGSITNAESCWEILGETVHLGPESLKTINEMIEDITVMLESALEHDDDHRVQNQDYFDRIRRLKRDIFA